jgi:hypothetical protein
MAAKGEGHLACDRAGVPRGRLYEGTRHSTATRWKAEGALRVWCFDNLHEKAVCPPPIVLEQNRAEAKPCVRPYQTPPDVVLPGEPTPK